MPKKRRSRKKRGSRSIKSKPRVEKHTEDRSFGSGLDEIGFRPLGRRIFVVKQRFGPRERVQAGSGTQTEPPTPTESPESTDSLGYDTRNAFWVRQAVEDALSGSDKDAIRKEIDSALRRWKLRD